MPRCICFVRASQLYEEQNPLAKPNPHSVFPLQLEFPLCLSPPVFYIVVTDSFTLLFSKQSWHIFFSSPSKQCDTTLHLYNTGSLRDAEKLCTYSQRSPSERGSAFTFKPVYSYIYADRRCECKLSMTASMFICYLHFIANPCPLEKTTSVVFSKPTLIGVAPNSAQSYNN